MMISRFFSVFFLGLSSIESSSHPIFCLLSYYLYKRHSLTVGASMATITLLLFFVCDGSRYGSPTLLYLVSQVSFDWTPQRIICWHSRRLIYWYHVQLFYLSAKYPSFNGWMSYTALCQATDREQSLGIFRSFFRQDSSSEFAQEWILLWDQVAI